MSSEARDGVGPAEGSSILQLRRPDSAGWNMDITHVELRAHRAELGGKIPRSHGIAPKKCSVIKYIVRMA